VLSQDLVSAHQRGSGSHYPQRSQKIIIGYEIIILLITINILIFTGIRKINLEDDYYSPFDHYVYRILSITNEVFVHLLYL
jgi:hypothetical protein